MMDSIPPLIWLQLVLLKLRQVRHFHLRTLQGNNGCDLQRLLSSIITDAQGMGVCVYFLFVLPGGPNHRSQMACLLFQVNLREVV